MILLLCIVLAPSQDGAFIGVANDGSNHLILTPPTGGAVIVDGVRKAVGSYCTGSGGLRFSFRLKTLVGRTIPRNKNRLIK